MAEITAVKKFKDDNYVHIEDEFEQVRKFIGMYISYRGTKAAIHLFKEIFNNALDECINSESPANAIDILYDESDGMITISDNGRGIRLDKLYEFCTKKHTTTKMDRENGVESAGENGVGLKVTAALSAYFKATSFRYGECKSIEVINGKEISDGTVQKCSRKTNGLTVQFSPSEEYLGQIHMSVDDICDWLRCMSYNCPKGISMVLTAIHKKTKKPEVRKYVGCGLAEDVKYIGQNLEFSPITVYGSQNDHEQEKHRFELEMSFSYDMTIDEESVDSYCNFVHTIENGTHVDACESALCTFLTKEASILEPTSKFPIIAEDCRKGLILIVRCGAKNPDFSGQVKERVGNELIASEGKKLMVQVLKAFFSKNPQALTKIIGYLRTIAKIRLTAHSMKGLDSKKTATWAEERVIKNFIGLSDRNSRGYKELFICEGLSAGSHVAAMVNHKYQAVYELRGVITNVYDAQIGTVEKSDTLRNLVTVLGCGAGKNFNINNLKWNKVIIFTDSDVDGSNITSLLCTFFAKFMPAIISSGRLYKVMPPLYLLAESNNAKYKGIDFLYNKHEFYNVYNKVVSENVDVELRNLDGTFSPLKKPELYAWMDMNMKYLYHLRNLTKKSGSFGIIVETVCWELLISAANPKKFEGLLKNDFTECVYDPKTKALSGAFDRQSVTLIIDDIFIQNARHLIGIMAKNSGLMLRYRNRNSKGDWDLVTNGQFLSAVEDKDSPTIDQRYKGLGEMEGEVLFRSTLNPIVRKLYRFSMKDAIRAMDDLGIMHCKDNADERKKLSQNDNYTTEDIDN